MKKMHSLDCPDISKDHPTPVCEQARIDTLKRFGVYIKPVSYFEQKCRAETASRFDIVAELAKAQEQRLTARAEELIEIFKDVDF